LIFILRLHLLEIVRPYDSDRRGRDLSSRRIARTTLSYNCRPALLNLREAFLLVLR